LNKCVATKGEEVKMPFKKGDFLLIDYVAEVKETGKIFDTTMGDIAKKEKLEAQEAYEPKLVVVGEGWILKALDESLTKLSLKKPETVEISPAEAFGPRNPEKVKMISLRRLREKGITPRPGMQVEYDRKLATVRAVGGGRVQLDFNPPLAGKTLVYNVTAVKKLRTRAERFKALIHRRIPAVEVVKFTIQPAKTSVSIELPEEAFYIEGIQLAKRGIAEDIRKTIPRISKVEFIENYTFGAKE
jgi:peptidylprolyl isomerase